MAAELTRCPFCNGSTLIVLEVAYGHAAYCEKCTAQGPTCRTRELAAAGWNRRTAQGAEPVAYLDIGAGGYLDIGSDLRDEQLSRLPRGRHMLAIVGTYGADGYAPRSSSPPTAEVEKKAARYDWLRALPLFGAWDVTRVRPNREWLIDSLRANELDAAIDAALQSDQAQAGKGV